MRKIALFCLLLLLTYSVPSYFNLDHKVFAQESNGDSPDTNADDDSGEVDDDDVPEAPEAITDPDCGELETAIQELRNDLEERETDLSELLNYINNPALLTAARALRALLNTIRSCYRAMRRTRVGPGRPGYTRADWRNDNPTRNIRRFSNLTRFLIRNRANLANLLARIEDLLDSLENLERDLCGDVSALNARFNTINTSASNTLARADASIRRVSSAQSNVETAYLDAIAKINSFRSNVNGVMGSFPENTVDNIMEEFRGLISPRRRLRAFATRQQRRRARVIACMSTVNDRARSLPSLP